jgi:phosphonate transport system substrate-binding protein
MKKIFTSILLLTCLTSLCNNPAFANEGNTSNDHTKREIVLSITDNGNNGRLSAIVPIASYLTKELNIEVRVQTVQKEKDMLDALKENAIDLAYINTFGYILAKQDSLPISLVAMPGSADGKPSVYNSCIISAKSKKITSLKDLVAGSKKHSFMFVNATSASGHLIPRLYFTKLGIPQAESSFKDIVFGGNHDAVIAKILSGEADAGAVAHNILLQQISQGKISKNDFNILWVSGPISQTPLVMNNKLEPELKAKISKAMLEMHVKDPALWKHVQKSFSAHDATNYIVAKDEHYNTVRDISGSIEDLLFILNFYLD